MYNSVKLQIIGFFEVFNGTLVNVVRPVVDVQSIGGEKKTEQPQAGSAPAANAEAAATDTLNIYNWSNSKQYLTDFY